MVEETTRAVGREIDPPLAYDNTGRQIALGAIAFGAVNLIKVCLQLLLLPLMARLLGPEEFGLYALVLPTIAFVTTLADGGLGTTLVRESESSELVWSSAFWLLLLTGFGLAVCASIFGVLFGSLIAVPRISPMIAVLSLSLVFLALSVSPSARLTRRKNLGVGAAVELSANLAGAAIGVALALRGAGAWSLVGQYIGISAVRAVLLNAAAFNWPAFEFSLAAIRPHMVSGGIMIGTRLSDLAGRTAENAIVNHLFGTALLGSFTFANQISKFAGESIGSVIWVALYVQALTGETRKVAELHRQLSRLLGAILFPGCLIAAAAAPQLVDLLLGPKWIDLAFMLRVLLPLWALTMIANQVGAILLAKGRFEIQFWCTIANNVGRLIAIGIGAWTGLTGALCGLAIVTILYFAAMLVASVPATGSRPLPVLQGLAGPAISSLIGAGACLASLQVVPAGVAGTLAGLIFGLAIFLISMLLLDRKGLMEDWQAIRRLASARAVQPPIRRSEDQVI
jgi:O-antigen/teichoic acid export membrane protein